MPRYLLTVTNLCFYCSLSNGISINNNLMKQYNMPRKTIYGKCPKCKTKSQLEVLSGKPGQEKFKCNMCYHTFIMDDL